MLKVGDRVWECRVRSLILTNRRSQFGNVECDRSGNVWSAITHLNKQAIAFGNVEYDRYTINCSNTNTDKPGKDGKRASFVRKNDAHPRIAVAI